MRPWVDADLHGWVVKPKDDAAWEKFTREYAGGESPRPLDQVIKVVRAGGCQTIVIENRYVDIDYRSEYSNFWSLKFDGQSPFTRRLHFFRADLDEKRLHDLPEDPGYLGYSIIRPVEHGRVGRTVLSPPPELANATLTSITDSVSLFGNRLEVDGVPFCQQDAEYLRCAHAAAWICHYVAYCRKMTGRKSTAEIVEMSPTMLSPERALPSKGMTLNQLQAVFGGLNQPAMFYGLSNMPRVPGVPDPEPTIDENGDPLPAGLWDKRLITVICRYLNSRFPVLIGAGDHAFVLVGWFREPGGQVRFIACDDQVGPYEVIDDPFAHYKTPWDSIMVPLPPRVFLSGESAEGRAHRVFRSIAAQTPALKWLADGLLQEGIVLRTTLRTGASYKEEVASQTSKDKSLQTVRYARLPHWVWIVEAHDKARCDKGEPCVVATAVFDSTSFDLAPPLDVLTVPGILVVYPPEAADPVIGPGSPEPWNSLMTVH
jgi:hypothetical protein